MKDHAKQEWLNKPRNFFKEACKATVIQLSVYAMVGALTVLFVYQFQG